MDPREDLNGNPLDVQSVFFIGIQRPGEPRAFIIKTKWNSRVSGIFLQGLVFKPLLMIYYFFNSYLVELVSGCGDRGLILDCIKPRSPNSAD